MQEALESGNAASVLYFPLYQFLRAAITNHHKLGGLKQQKCVFSQFWRPSTKSRCRQGRLPLEAPGRILPSPAPGGSRRSWLVDTSPQSLPHRHTASSPVSLFLFLLCLLGHLSLVLGPTLIQDDLILRS